MEIINYLYHWRTIYEKNYTEKWMERSMMFNSKEEYNEWFEKNRLFNRISDFFEKEENWSKLKECYLIGDRSEDFRQLLKQAMGLKEL